MSLMEFLKDNTFNTTTQVKVESNTALVEFLFDRNKGLQYATDGYGSNTSTIISIEFSTPTVISNVILQNHNLKDYRIFYNSSTANTFTPDALVSGNSASSTYFDFASTTINSVQLQMDTAQTTDTEKAIGQFVVTEKRLAFEQNPTSKAFKPIEKRTQVKHKMPDGGTILYNIADKYDTKVGFKFITTSFRNALRGVYDDALPLYFLPFPTTTSWDGDAFPVVWTGAWDFKFGSNVKESGWNGNIKIEERSST